MNCTYALEAAAFTRRPWARVALVDQVATSVVLLLAPAGGGDGRGSGSIKTGHVVKTE